MHAISIYYTMLEYNSENEQQWLHLRMAEYYRKWEMMCLALASPPHVHVSNEDFS